MHPTKIMFVCQGNICRSPLAQALFEHKLAQRGIADRYRVDSTGVSAYHAGESADRRMRETAAGHGVSIRHKARSITQRDLEESDLVLAMDDGNLTVLRQMAAGLKQHGEIRKFRDFDPQVRGDSDVPDPWYGDMAGFEEVYNIVERTCSAMLDELEGEQGT